MDQKPFVFIATPCFGALLHQSYVQSLIALLQHLSAQDIRMTLGLLGHDSLITRSRNTLLARFLDTPEATHLLFIDADIAFDPQMVERMLRADKEVAAGIYPLKVHNWSAPARARVRGGEPLDSAPLLYVGRLCEGEALERDGAFATAVYAGTGFMMIRRDAVLRMVEHYPETRYRGIHAHTGTGASAGEGYALFDCTIDPETGTYLSEDYTFCHRWRAIGGKIWLDTEGSLTHVGAHDFVGAPLFRFSEAAALDQAAR